MGEHDTGEEWPPTPAPTTVIAAIAMPMAAAADAMPTRTSSPPDAAVLGPRWGRFVGAPEPSPAADSAPSSSPWASARPAICSCDVGKRSGRRRTGGSHQLTAASTPYEPPAVAVQQQRQLLLRGAAGALAHRPSVCCVGHSRRAATCAVSKGADTGNIVRCRGRSGQRSSAAVSGRLEMESESASEKE